MDSTNFRVGGIKNFVFNEKQTVRRKRQTGRVRVSESESERKKEEKGERERKSKCKQTVKCKRATFLRIFSFYFILFQLNLSLRKIQLLQIYREGECLDKCC